MNPIKDVAPSFGQMVTTEKYERVIAYLYPIAQSIKRRHGVARDMFLQRLLGIPELIFIAGKSQQISRLYAVDSALADLRFWLRFLHSIGELGTNQLQAAQILIAEVGCMVGSWMKKK
jgi:hypothetical protein